VVSPLATLEVAGGNNQTVALAGVADIQVPLILTVPLSDFPGQFEVKVLVGNQDGEIENERNIPFLGPFRE
jgi:hypothetical protein